MATQSEITLKSHITGLTEENFENKLDEYNRELKKRILSLECANINITTKIRMLSFKEIELYSEIDGEG